MTLGSGVPPFQIQEMLPVGKKNRPLLPKSIAREFGSWNGLWRAAVLRHALQGCSKGREYNYSPRRPRAAHPKCTRRTNVTDGPAGNIRFLQLAGNKKSDVQ